MQDNRLRKELIKRGKIKAKEFDMQIEPDIQMHYMFSRSFVSLWLMIVCLGKRL